MKKSKYTDSQNMDALKRAEAGLAVSEICRELEISSATFYKWRARYGGMCTLPLAGGRSGCGAKETQIYSSSPRKREPSTLIHWVPAFAGTSRCQQLRLGDNLAEIKQSGERRLGLTADAEFNGIETDLLQIG